MTDGISTNSPRPVPQPVPTPYNPNAINAMPGILVLGTSNPTSSSETKVSAYNTFVSPFVSVYDQALYGKESTKVEISADRAELLKKYGYRTWIGVTGDQKGDGNKKIPANDAMTFARIQTEDAVKNRKFVSGDPLQRNENWQLYTNRYQTNGVTNFASMNELADKIISGSNGIPFATLFINTHGDENNLFVVDRNGNAVAANMSGELFSFLTKLKNAGLLVRGARITLGGCSIASSEYARNALQHLSDVFGIEIIAAKKVSYDDAPNMSDYASFTPDPNYKPPKPASLADIKGDTPVSSGNNQSGVGATKTESQTPSNVSLVKTKNFKIVFSNTESRLNERLKKDYPKVHQFISRYPTRTNQILENDANGSRVLQNALARGDYDTFAREFAKLTR